MALSARQAALLLPALVLGFYACLGLALWRYDPLQLYRPAVTADAAEPALHRNMRFQAAGVINSFDFDSMVLGTSLLENTSAAEASRLLGGRFVNLSVSNGNFYERSLILRHALRQKDLRTVLYSLDHVFLSQQVINPDYPASLYDFLYDRWRVNDVAAYFNDRYLRCLATWSSTRVCRGERRGLDSPNAWGGNARHLRRFGGLPNWFAPPLLPRQRQVLGELAATALGRQTQVQPPLPGPLTGLARHYVDDYLLDIARAHPDTRFVLVFPPYTRLRYAIWAQREPWNMTAYRGVVRHVVKVASQLPNVQVYGWDDTDLPDDIASYKDTSHFHPRWNSWMLEAVSREEGLLTPDGLPGYLLEARKRANRYPLLGMGRRMQRYLEP